MAQTKRIIFECIESTDFGGGGGGGGGHGGGAPVAAYGGGGGGGGAPGVPTGETRKVRSSSRMLQLLR